MKTIGISQLKSDTLTILDQVSKTQESVVITKQGKPLAQIVPYHQFEKNPKPGQLADVFVFEKDIVSPLEDVNWESAQ